jgi:uncharacterized damage-inducible protein DinB
LTKRKAHSSVLAPATPKLVTFDRLYGIRAASARFEMLLGTKEHEMHHRGQLMLIERILGIVPHLTRHMQERMAAASSVPAR